MTNYQRFQSIPRIFYRAGYAPRGNCQGPETLTAVTARKELLAPGVETRDATVDYPVQVSIVPMLRNPVFTSEMKILDFTELYSTWRCSKIPYK